MVVDMQNVQCTYPPLERELVDAINAIEQRVVGHRGATESLDRHAPVTARWATRLMARMRAVSLPRLGRGSQDRQRASMSADVQRVRSAYAPMEQWRVMR